MSTSSRLEALIAMASKKPDDPMIQYGLATEYKKAGDLTASVEAYRAVLRLKADYTAAYQELGSTLVEMGQIEDARGVFQQGVEIAEKTGAWKPLQHMRRLLDELGADAADKGAPDAFCD